MDNNYLTNNLIKYPRTPHIEGSRLQEGDDGIQTVSFADIAGTEIVIEEKCDGANSAISFGADGGLLLQSRGHYLTGGYRERHYNLLKQWATAHHDAFYEVLGSRYIMYGEWMYAKHTVFYDSLPHYFLEFDILDRQSGKFLDTPSRHEMLSSIPVVSVPVITAGRLGKITELTDLIVQSKYIKEGHIGRLLDYCAETGNDGERNRAETDPSVLMEGLYIKIERDGEVIGRMKYVRQSFRQCVELSNSHWLTRPIIPNRLSIPVSAIFAPELPGGESGK